MTRTSTDLIWFIVDCGMENQPLYWNPSVSSHVYEIKIESLFAYEAYMGSCEILLAFEKNVYK